MQREQIERRLRVLCDWKARFGASSEDEEEMAELENRLDQIEQKEHVSNNESANFRRELRLKVRDAA